MMTSLLLFAQEQQPDPGWGALLANPITLMFLVLILFWFMVLLPNQRRERRDRENLLSSLKKYDEVVTNAGIIGTVANIKDNEVSLKIDDNARMRVLKSAIVKILPKEGAAEAATDTTKKS